MSPCTKCGKANEETTKTCLSCKQANHRYKQTYKIKYPDRYKNCKPRAHKRKKNDYIRNLRKDVVSFLGGVCKKCGFSDYRALQIDHVYGGGTKERRSLKTCTYYRKVMADVSGNYQLLCANCNWIKRHENKEFVQKKSTDCEERV